MGAIYNCISQGVIQIIRGCDYDDVVSLSNLDGTPLDLTDYTATSQLRTYTGALAGNFDCTISDPSNGQIAVHMPATTTAGLSPSTPIAPHVWGIRLTAGDGSVLPELQGGCLVVAGVVQ